MSDDAGLVFNWDTDNTQSVSWNDVPAQDDEILSQDDEILEVPELTGDSLTEIETALTPDKASSVTPDGVEDGRQRATPGSEVACDICGKPVVVKRDGYLRQHKCEAPAQRGTRLEKIPPRRPPTPQRVREFSIGVIAWAVEEGTASTIGRAVGCDPAIVPSELPDADDMIGPPLDLIWPSIPDAAQRFIAKIADEADLIACGIAWWDWLRVLSKFTREHRAYNQRIAQEREAHGPTQFTGEASTVGGRVVPFTPA